MDDDDDTDASVPTLPAIPTVSRSYVPPYDEALHDHAFALYVQHDGNMAATAKSLDVSYNTVVNWKRHGDWQGRIDRAESDLTASARRRVHRILRDHVPELIETMLAIARGQVAGATVSDRRLATRDLLDRAGYAPIRQLLIDQRTASLSVSATLNPDTPPPTTEEAIAILTRIMSDDARDR